MRRSDVHDWLTRLVGAPKPVSREDCGRTETVFAEQTSGLLEEIAVWLDRTSRVLVVGCGEGQELGLFAERSASAVGAGTSESSIARAMQRCSAYTNVECRVADGRTLPFPDNEFDLIFGLRAGIEVRAASWPRARAACASWDFAAAYQLRRSLRPASHRSPRWPGSYPSPRSTASCSAPPAT